ncbi:hypothetical protein FKM82_029721 [Ascaphus truei]
MLLPPTPSCTDPHASGGPPFSVPGGPCFGAGSDELCRGCKRLWNTLVELQVIGICLLGKSSLVRGVCRLPLRSSITLPPLALPYKGLADLNAACSGTEHHNFLIAFRAFASSAASFHPHR